MRDHPMGDLGESRGVEDYLNVGFESHGREVAVVFSSHVTTSPAWTSALLQSLPRRGHFHRIYRLTA